MVSLAVFDPHGLLPELSFARARVSEKNPVFV